MAVLAAIAMPLVVLLLIGVGAFAGAQAIAAVAPGASHDGVLLGAAPTPGWRDDGDAPLVADRRGDERSADGPLTLRRGCAWGQPGRDPYRGSTEQALAAAGLPPEVVREIAALHLAGRKTDRLEIRTGSIRALGDGRRFDPRSIALSFGRTMCLNSRVNFVAGHAEAADLYEVRDAQGRRHSVMVPDVCGNVSVLAALRERGVLDRLADAFARRSADAAAVAFALAQPDAPGASYPAGAAGREQPLAMASGSSSQGLGRPGDTGGKQALGLNPHSESGATGGLPKPTRPPGATLPHSLLPRQLAAEALNRLSGQLAQHSAALAKLADKTGRSGTSPSPAGGSTLSNHFVVPEPGTLACVLLALAVLVGIGRRGR